MRMVSLFLLRTLLPYSDLSNREGGGGYPYETTTTLQKRLNLELGGEMLEAGDHVFVSSLPTCKIYYIYHNFLGRE